MDYHRFDTLTRSLISTGSRRRALAAALSGAFGVLGLVPADDATAAKKCPPCKKRKKGKCKKNKPDGTVCGGGNCQGGRCLAATCSDGFQNGRETGIDCGGGTCPRCAAGLSCAVRNDCAGALCTDGTCQTCSANPNSCGIATDGTACSCIGGPGRPSVCGKTTPTGGSVLACNACPDGTVCSMVQPDIFFCYPRCD